MSGQVIPSRLRRQAGWTQGGGQSLLPPLENIHRQISSREITRDQNGSPLPANEETHRGQPWSPRFTAFSRGEVPDKRHHKSDYDPEVCSDSSEPTVHALWTTTWKPTTSWLGFLVSFPTWPHWPWSSHQRDLAKQRSDRVALPWEWRVPPSSPILQINPTLTRPGFQAPSSLLPNPSLEEKGAEVCPPGGPEEPESTGSPSSTAAPLPPPGESTGRNF